MGQAARRGSNGICHLRGRLPVLAGIVLACLVLGATARISMRFPLAGGCPVQALERLGGQRLLRNRMQVNGTDAVVSVYGLDLPAAFVGERLRQALDLATSQAVDASRISWRTQAGFFTALILPMGETARTVLLLVEAAADPWKSGRARPPDPPLPDWPMPPQSHLLFNAHNHDTGTTFSIAESAAAPDAAILSLTDQLQAAGWQPVPAAASAGMSLFVGQKGKTGILFAVAGEGQTGSRVVWLQKEAATR